VTATGTTSHGLTEEERMLCATVRAFVDREVKPTVREIEHRNEYPAGWIDQMKRIGIFGLAVPERYRGTPVSMLCYAMVTQELARGWMSLAGAMGGHTVVAKLLSLYGSDEQKHAYLPRMAGGQLRATMAFDRARRRIRSAEYDDAGAARRRRAGDQRDENVDFQRTAIGVNRPVV
jgi:alkylation response protein AidB-like acyl-CoA dehydrogenase